MLERAGIKLPSTTNSLEAFHGQLNSQIPRPNSFQNSLYRICKNFLRKNNSINELIKHNYSYEKKQTVGNAIRNEERMGKEVQFYQTKANYCLCEQNQLLSSILNIDFPYVHRIFIGEEFPECPTLDIQFKPNWDELLVETGDIEDDITPEKVLNNEIFDKIYIIQMIRR